MFIDTDCLFSEDRFFGRWRIGHKINKGRDWVKGGLAHEKLCPMCQPGMNCL